jgi:hypothetical protein
VQAARLGSLSSLGVQFSVSHTVELGKDYERSVFLVVWFCVLLCRCTHGVSCRAAVALGKLPAYKDIKAPVLRPTNYVRSFVHVMNAVIGVVAYEFFLSHTFAVAVMFAVFARCGSHHVPMVLSCSNQSVFFIFFLFTSYVAMDVARRFFPAAEAGLFDGLFQAVTRPRERYVVPAATWFEGYCFCSFLFDHVI